ncbi:MAG: hypothetical protein KDA24_29695 [Deltaproteobacteria bacterium]|nr:hypothetical protein [Deltaproteobacteria bacterium]
MRHLAFIPLLLALGCQNDVGLTAVPDDEVPERPYEDEPAQDDEETAEEPPEEEPPEDEGENENEPPAEEPPEDEEPPEEEPPEEEPPPEDDCVGVSDLVYVIDRDEEALYLFDPPTGDVTLVGELDCGLWSGTPASMSVSRDGYAYVRYSDQTVYSVDLETLDCTETSYGSSFGSFGMGFATDSATTWQDTLYVANSNQLAMLDVATWSLNTIGGLPSQSELTGNAAGELWAMLPLESPAELVRLNKTTAQVEQTVYLSGFPNPYDIDTFAFATWGGSFYLFVRTYGMGNSTDIYEVSATGQMSLLAGDTGMNVVGAGVSTCAPTN